MSDGQLCSLFGEHQTTKRPALFSTVRKTGFVFRGVSMFFSAGQTLCLSRLRGVDGSLRNNSETFRDRFLVKVSSPTNLSCDHESLNVLVS